MVCVHKFESLISGLLLRRYKRFLADVNINGIVTTVHCPNTGSLVSVLDKTSDSDNDLNLECLMSVTQNKNRKYENSLEMVYVNGIWVGIHSALANKIVLNALNSGLISECLGYSHLLTEVSSKDSKIDFQLIFGEYHQTENSVKKRKRATASPDSAVEIGNQMFVEVKSVTMVSPNSSIAEFPDCVSVRATKHANFLANHVRAGGRAAILFLIQRSDVTSFTISSLDTEYQQAIHEASSSGVLILPYICSLSLEHSEIHFGHKVPFIDPCSESAPGRNER
jgi:sugar fermentation stimulation protein A